MKISFSALDAVMVAFAAASCIGFTYSMADVRNCYAVFDEVWIGSAGGPWLCQDDGTCTVCNRDYELLANGNRVYFCECDGSDDHNDENDYCHGRVEYEQDGNYWTAVDADCTGPCEDIDDGCVKVFTPPQQDKRLCGCT